MGRGGRGGDFRGATEVATEVATPPIVCGAIDGHMAELRHEGRIVAVGERRWRRYRLKTANGQNRDDGQ